MAQYTKDELKQIQIDNGRKHYENISKHQLDNIDSDKALEVRKKGHKAMIEKRKQKKNIMAICKELLDIEASDIASDVLSPQIAKRLEGTDITLYDLIVARQIEKAISDGDVKSAVFIRDSNGDKPTERTETDINIINDNDKELLNLLNDRIDVLEGLHNNTIIDVKAENSDTE